VNGEGFAIIDAGISFGGGQLGNYGINSNTSGAGFLKCTYKKMERMVQIPQSTVRKTSVKQPKEQQLKKPPPKQWEVREDVEVLTPFRDLYNSNISKVLRDFGKNIAPLPVVGHFLNYVGNHLLHYIH